MEVGDTAPGSVRSYTPDKNVQTLFLVTILTTSCLLGSSVSTILWTLVMLAVLVGRLLRRAKKAAAAVCWPAEPTRPESVICYSADPLQPVQLPREYTCVGYAVASACYACLCEYTRPTHLNV